jgi:hypothetical protein
LVIGHDRKKVHRSAQGGVIEDPGPMLPERFDIALRLICVFRDHRYTELQSSMPKLAGGLLHKEVVQVPVNPPDP